MDQNGSTTGLEWIRFGALALGGRDTPILALRSAVPVGYRRVQNQGGGNWYYELCFDSLYGMSAAVDWYLFDRPPAAPSGYTVRVRDGVGREVFNVNHRYFRPKAFVAVPGGQPSARAAPWDYTGLPVGTYACVPAASRFASYSFTIFDQSNGTSALTDGVQALANGVRVAPAPQQDQAPYPGDPGIYVPPMEVGYVTIVDVAGY
ncbi:hypothetical protein [Cupriavidus nantongensis]